MTCERENFDIWNVDGDEVEDLLVKLKTAADPSGIAAAAFRLSLSDDKRKIDPLLLQLGHESETVRQAVVMGLSRSTHRKVEESLIRHAKDDVSPAVRAQCIGGLAHGSKRAVSVVRHAVNDENADVRVQVALALMWRRSRKGIRLLRRMLTDGEWKVRLAACQALLLHEAVDEELVQTISALSEDPLAAQHDEQTILVRDEIRKRFPERAEDTDFVETAGRTLEEMRNRARQLAETRRNIGSRLRWYR